MAAQEHYFAPGKDYPAKQISVTLAGRELRVWTSGGTFSPDHVDDGTEALLAHLDRLAGGGSFLDLGCGWGPIALSLAILRPDSTIYAVDVNDAALKLLQKTCGDLGIENILAMRPEQVPLDAKFDQIWSNPPIRIGKPALHELLEAWLTRLLPGGQAYLVVQKQLGADSLTAWLNEHFAGLNGLSATRLSTDKGFRVIEVKS